tara:strand:+ start:178 stop:726 length:549 start_codon:yes stop_codon:yes gene_type:complete
MNKWIGISLGTLLGVSHLGMIGMIANRPSKMPTLNLPVNDYTSYKARVSEDEYVIEYNANDPKTVQRIREVKKKAGFLGLGNNIESIVEEVPVDGSLRSQRDEMGGVAGDNQKKSVACTEAVGGGKQTGRIVGASIGGAVATTGIASIPFVGWVLAGAATMIGMDQGAEIGGQMVEDLNKNC